MKIMNVFYYFYFLFYKRILKDPEPHVAAILALSFSESLSINGILDIIALKFFCYEIKVIVQFSIAIILIILNFLYFPAKKARKIISNKPCFFGARTFSLISTILFFLVTTSWLFWGSIYGKYLLTKCR